MDDVAVAADARGIPLDVVAAGVAFCAAMSAVATTALLPQDSPSLVLLAPWPLFALGGGAVLDRLPGHRLGWTLVVLALVPLATLATALVRERPLTSAGIVTTIGHLAGLQAVLLVVAVLAALHPPGLGGAAAASVAAVGAALTALDGAAARSGWALAVTGMAGLAALQLVSTQQAPRTDHRRLALVIATFAAGGIALTVTHLVSTLTVTSYVASSVLVLTTVSVTCLALTTELRPLDEDLLDVGVLLGALAVAGLTALLVWLGSDVVHLASARTSASSSALVTLALALPGAVWARRALLARRYGNGVIAPEDVARITADLHNRTEPRDLLGKAARMVAAASGTREVRIVLGDELPEQRDGWVVKPLVVGGGTVGALLIDAADPEGLEPRRERVVAQLLPTVGLVARAVGLAVEAELARRDVARERDAERARILRDLHDGMGPALAGMSMRVRAALRSEPPAADAELLGELAAGLAESRTDLRRIVSGLTPSALADGDLELALQDLAASFGRACDGPHVGLHTELAGVVLSQEVQVTVYRCVAEGITNALRHAAPGEIEVSVVAPRDRIAVDVDDDGVGGIVVPGVGLSSLAARAAAHGGRLRVTPGYPKGTHVHMELPR